MYPKKITWDWTVSFGNIVSLVLTIGAVAVAAIGLYVRYEKRFQEQSLRIEEVENDQMQLLRTIRANGTALDHHEDDPIMHMPEAEKYIRFVPRVTYEVDQRSQDQRLKDFQTDIKSDLSEIKGMVRENGRTNLEQYQSLAVRIDKANDS